MDGFTCTVWASRSGGASSVTCTHAPPTVRANMPILLVVVTTFSCAHAGIDITPNTLKLNTCLSHTRGVIVLFMPDAPD
jgi:hypothetical protein